MAGTGGWRAAASGVIVTEGMTVHADIMRHAQVMQFHRKDVVPSLRRVTDAVHEEGALIVCQLNHGGRQHHGSYTLTLWAPSAIACPASDGIPHQMSKAEIAEVVAGFARAASNAVEQIGDGILSCRVARAVHPFVLQAVEEALGRGVIPEFPLRLIEHTIA